MRIVYSYYVLDIVHRGHLKMMKNAKAVAGKDGISMVGILTKEAVLEKKSKKPILSFDERMNLAEELQCTDVVVPQETYSPIPNLKGIKPDVCMESSSHKGGDVEEVRKYMELIGGRVVVVPYYPFQSSTRIKNQIKE